LGAEQLDDVKGGRSRRRVRATYDALSRWYDTLAGPWERRLRAVGLGLLAAKPGERILEIGCATGETLAALAAAAGEAGMACGLDLSPRMLQVARRRLVAGKPARHAQLVRGDATRVGFAPEMYQCLFMSFTLELFDDQEIPAVLAECGRVLCPGGRIVVVSLSKAGRSGVRDVYEWGHRMFPAILDCRPIHIRAVLEQAGFRVLGGVSLSLAGLPVEAVLAGAIA
jgi:demethylmenaquinone methyltransferase/2-methoxy-6-polyprenyl-1,4-benzoquinol methylase